MDNIYNNKEKYVNTYQQKPYYLKGDFDFNDDFYRQKYVERAELEKKSSIAHMGEIVVSTREKPIVGTIGLATCYGIIFYDRKNKKAWVGHGPASAPIFTLSIMLKDIKNVIGDLEYGIIPSWDNIKKHDFKICDEMDDYLHRNCPKYIRLLQITNLDIKQDNRSNPSYEFAFNAETGKSVTYELFCEEDFLSSRKK